MESGYRARRRNRKLKKMRAIAALAAAALLTTVIIAFSMSRGDAVEPPSAPPDGVPKSVRALDEQPQDGLLQDGNAVAEIAMAETVVDPRESPAPKESPAPGESLDSDAAALPLYDDAEIQARWTSEGITKYTRKEARMLPILDYSKEASDKVAITIDDCFQFDNLRAILDLADEYGAKLTFFPIGYQIGKQPELWQEILDRGHELENHSYHHVTITTMSDDKLFRTITMQERAMNKALGVNYKMKYFRPKGGAGRKQLRLSKMLRDLGYQAVASWGLSGSQNVNTLIKKCSGGHVVLFHTTDKDLSKLKKLFPALKKKGLKMVTLNELYGKPKNVITPLPPPSAPPAN